MNNKSLNKLLAIAILFGTAFSANACDIVVRSGSQKVMNAYNRGAVVPDAICAKLKQAGAQLVINGDASIVNGLSYAWASISVADLKNKYIHPIGYEHGATWVAASTDRTMLQEKFTEMLSLAMSGMNIDNNINLLNEARRSFKK